MKIISFNTYTSNQQKLDRILADDAEIYVIPELANENYVSVPVDCEVAWTGKDCDRKGLGVVWKKSHKCVVPDWFNDQHTFGLPLIVDDKWLLLAIWANNRTNGRQYPVILSDILQEYESYLKQYKSLIIGDFNCFKGENFKTIVEHIAAFGYYSIYHKQTGEELYHESQITYYHQFKADAPFFADYAYTNIPGGTIRIGDWDRTFSDHVPLYVDLPIEQL